LRPSTDPPAGQVLTLVDYFEGGRRVVQGLLSASGDRNGPGFAGIIERNKRACVRLDIRVERSEGIYESVLASGVMIESGRLLLTAGHSFVGRSGYEILVTLHNGEQRRAHLVAHRYDVEAEAGEDWAILEMLGPPLHSLPEVRLEAAHAGDLAFILGYPDQIGVDADGAVAHASVAQDGYLEPLETLGIVDRLEPLILTPWAGSIPIGGMSGGPVFNGSGGLVGIFVSVRKTAGAAGMRYSYRAASVQPLRDRLGDL
jgi:S1-C subfamily serine protease